MKHGFIKTAAVTPRLKVADIKYNIGQIKNYMDKAEEYKINLVVFPELSVTGKTCGDLFYSQTVLSAAEKGIEKLCKYSKDKYPVFVVGAPIRFNNSLYSCAVVIFNGEILGIVPKINTSLDKQFKSGRGIDGNINYASNQLVPFLSEQIFTNENYSNFSFCVQVSEDLYAPVSPCVNLAFSGATIVANLSAEAELVGSGERKENYIKTLTDKIPYGYVLSASGADESTGDMVYSGHNVIAENGDVLVSSNHPQVEGMIISDIDVEAIVSRRLKNFSDEKCDLFEVYFNQPLIETKLSRKYNKNPFIPEDKDVLEKRAESILQTQSLGLKKRIEHTFAKKIVIGISGGLDSTLALLVTNRTVELLNRPKTDILAITMPGFGTTSRTKSNAVSLCELLGVEIKEISISEAVKLHFSDIGQDENNHDVTYENSQARERTQILMDIANKEGGMVIGTGDLSELALGWATYNGDHMSMYGVNASVPKTLIKYLVEFEANRFGGEIKTVLNDIVATPVSPELLPADENGDIAQKTENLVGPYELHDFFLYYVIKCGFGPEKIYKIATHTLGDIYKDEEIVYWLKNFFRRFITQQYKRSCLPDGAKVGSISLSPRGDWNMPSDASANLWLSELENL